MAKPRLYSGMQPSSGSLHLGNYIGALQQWRGMQDEYDAFFSIVDLQSVLELAEIADTHITDVEVKAPHQLIAALCDCIQQTAADPASIELTRHARMWWARLSDSYCRGFLQTCNFYKIIKN